MVLDKLLVVFTGGTISCRVQNKVMNATADAPYALISRYEETQGGVVFETASPLTILSENLLPDDWKTMADCIRKRMDGSYSGVVVAHGTDTLAYTACALSFMLSGLRLPVVLVAADYPLDDPRSNGYANFIAAVDWIKSERLPGVYAVWTEPGESRTSVHMGTRLTQAAAYTGRFSSITGRPLGVWDGHAFSWAGAQTDPGAEQLREKAGGTLTVYPALKNCIQYIRPYPGIDYSRLAMPSSVRAVFHGLYHSGTACVRQAEGGDSSLSSFASRCSRDGRTVYSAPLWFSENHYASADKLTDVRRLPPMSEEAAYVKLLLAFNLYPENQEARDAYLENDIAFEQLKQLV